mgnify:CR=1 FL=1
MSITHVRARLTVDRALIASHTHLPASGRDSGASRMVRSSSSTSRPDTQMPADFLTKWIPAAKLEQSLRYACNAHERRGLSLPKEV